MNPSLENHVCHIGYTLLWSTGYGSLNSDYIEIKALVSLSFEKYLFEQMAVKRQELESAVSKKRIHTAELLSRVPSGLRWAL